MGRRAWCLFVQLDASHQEFQKDIRRSGYLQYQQTQQEHTVAVWKGVVSQVFLEGPQGMEILVQNRLLSQDIRVWYVTE
jgi:hypothetical protein